MISPGWPRRGGGNTVTALRWRRRLRELGARVHTAATYAGEPADLLVALHARKSAAAVELFHARFPRRPIVVALTGTDLYRDLPRGGRAAARVLRSLALAHRIVLLQPRARKALPPRQRRKAVTILQSSVPARTQRSRSGSHRGRAGRRTPIDVAVVANLRPVKDPLRAALAARRLPATSRIRIVHAGRALSPGYAQRARREMQVNPRYRWLGERSHAATRRLVARSRALVLSSRLEGGANVVSEAIVAGVPVLASRIEGSISLLGERYPGYFPAGDTARLAALLDRIESDARFAAALGRSVRRLAPSFTPARERAVWAALLRGLGLRPPRARS